VTRDRELYLDRLRSMTECEWRLREQSTLSGFLWTLLQPALLFGTLYLVFTRWLRLNDPSFAPRLLVGVVLYGFFHAATSYGISSLNRRASLALSFVFPRELVVLSACLSVALSHLWELLVMAGFLLLFGARPSASWLLLPALAAGSLALACGLSLLLAPAAARHPDLERAWGVVLLAGFYLTPVFYPASAAEGGRAALLRANPLTHLLEAARACLLDGRAPWGPAALLLLGGVAALALGLLAFRAAEPRLGESLSRGA
jgi:ABC-type polysaccharide/polyol phosphate export permease